jgi:hypothetical protein
MDNKVISQAEGDEEVLTLDIPDDALERAANAERKAFTVVHCTNSWYDCGWPQWPRLGRMYAGRGGFLFD